MNANIFRRSRYGSYWTNRRYVSSPAVSNGGNQVKFSKSLFNGDLKISLVHMYISICSRNLLILGVLHLHPYSTFTSLPNIKYEYNLPVVLLDLKNLTTEK